MSTKGIFTALSGAMAQSNRLDTISNNIANSNTTAFKKDKQTFNEYVTANEKGTDVIQVPKIPASVESFYDMQGGDRGYVDASGTYTDFTQGNLRPTSNALDFGIEGKGFFEVFTPQGRQFTRSGSLKIDSQGRLVTKEGHPVLSEGQGDPAGRVIQLENRNITVSYNGDIYAGGENIGKLSVVDIPDNSALQKVGNSSYKIKNNYNTQPAPAADVKVFQGYLESSNVNVVSEMTDMISATRAFEATTKAIKAFDNINEKLVNVVPKVN